MRRIDMRMLAKGREKNVRRTVRSSSVGKVPVSFPIVPGSNPTGCSALPLRFAMLSEAELRNNGAKNMSEMRKRISIRFHTVG